MNFASEASKLLTNKYFLYFMVFLAASNVLGYLVSNKVNAVIFFALVAFLVSNFSKNMSVILLVAIIATNLLMANKTMREGLENANMTTSLTDEQKATAQASAQEKKTSMQETNNLDDIDPQLGSGVHALKTAGNTEDAKAALKTKAQEKKASVQATNTSSEDTEAFDIQDPNNRDIKRTTEPLTFKPTKSRKSAFHNPKGSSSLSNAAPVKGGARIDYATTLEDAYTNLEDILGNDGIGRLTQDTQKLMTQQTELFKTMQNIVPMVETAKNMMDSLDMDQLGGMADMLKGTKK